MRVSEWFVREGFYGSMGNVERRAAGKIKSAITKAAKRGDERAVKSIERGQFRSAPRGEIKSTGRMWS